MVAEAAETETYTMEGNSSCSISRVTDGLNYTWSFTNDSSSNFNATTEVNEQTILGIYIESGKFSFNKSEYLELQQTALLFDVGDSKSGYICATYGSSGSTKMYLLNNIDNKTYSSTDYLVGNGDVYRNSNKISNKQFAFSEDDLISFDSKYYIGFYNPESTIKPNQYILSLDEPETIGTKYDVIFNTDGGSSIDSQSVEEGSYATKPTDPTKDGFTFGGWYTDTTFETEFDFETMAITGPTTICAKWVAAFDVNYYVDGAFVNTVAIEQNKTIGEQNAFTYTAPENYTFSGWYSDEDCTIPFDFANTVIIADTNIYGKTTENKNYTISYYVNNELYKEEKVYVGNTIIEATYEAPEGYSFFGWYSDNSYTDEYDFTAELNSDVNVYGYTEEKTKYLVSFIIDGSTYHSENVYEGEMVSKPSDPIKEGYAFGGWYTDNTYAEEYDFSESIISATSIYGKFVKGTFQTNTYILDFETVASEIGTLTDKGTFNGTESTNFLSVNGTITYRTGNSNTIIKSLEIGKNETGSLDFKATGLVTITAGFSSTGGSNTSVFGFMIDDTYLEIDQHDEFNCAANEYSVTGTSAITVSLTFDASSISGGQTISIVSPNSGYNRGVRILSLEISETILVASDEELTPSVDLKKQYNDDANPTAVRFFGVLTNITDTNAIESITLTIESNGRTGTKNINTIWKSVNVGDAEGSTGATFEEATNTYYAVYSIVNIPETEIGVEYSVTITVEFTEASGIETINANRTFIMGQE